MKNGSITPFCALSVLLVTALLFALLESARVYGLDYYATLKLDGDMPQFTKKTLAAKILAFVAEYELLLQTEAKLGFFKKLALRFTYGLKNFKFYGQSVENITPYCQNIY